MLIVQALSDHVEDLLDPLLLPSVDEIRPSSCPLCGELAVRPGRPLGIVGHGTYRRQVLGLVDVVGEAAIKVRRYFCRGCGHTLSVLADQLHPRRWYSAEVILEALGLHLLEGLSEGEVRRRFQVVVGSESWRSLRRWRCELLFTLWYWLARRFGARGKAETRQEGRRRLRQLLSEAMSATRSRAARALLRSTAHFRGLGWPLGRDPPESLEHQTPR